MLRLPRLAPLAPIVTIAVLLMAVGGADGRKVCAASSGRLAPRLLSPCNGTVLPLRHAVTLTISDTNPAVARFNEPYVLLTRKAPRHGHVPVVNDALGIVAFANPVHGHHGHFTLTAPVEPFAGYWLITPGKYYLQIRQPDRGHTYYSPVYTLTVR
jgi:hypothetical protein